MRALFIIFIFSCFFTDCASKGRVSPLTYRTDLDGADFLDLDDRVCDLKTLQAVTVSGFEIEGSDPNKVFSQQVDYKLYCKDSLKEKKDKEGNVITVDLIDSLFLYYKDEVFPNDVARDGESFRDSFFLFVHFFQKQFLKTAFPDDGDSYDNLKLLKEDITVNNFAEEKSEDENQVNRKIKRSFWTKHKFPVILFVTGFIKTEGSLAIKKEEKNGVRILTITYESEGEPNVVGSHHLKNTKKITEHVKMEYTPSDDNKKLNFSVSVKRKDFAFKPSEAKWGDYEGESTKLFKKIIFSSAIEHFSHLGRYLIFQSPSGFRGVMHGKLMAVLKAITREDQEKSKISVKSKVKGKEYEAILDVGRSDKWSLTTDENNTKQVLKMDIDVPQNSFSSKNEETFLVSIALDSGMDNWWSQFLGVEEETDQLTLPIKEEDGSLKLKLFQNKKEKKGLFRTKKDGESEWVYLRGKPPSTSATAIETLENFIENNTFSAIIDKKEGKKGYTFSVSLKKGEINFTYDGWFQERIEPHTKIDNKTLSANYELIEDSYDPKDKSFKINLKHEPIKQPFSSKLGLKKETTDSSWKIKLKNKNELFLKRNYVLNGVYLQVIRDEWIPLGKVEN